MWGGGVREGKAKGERKEKEMMLSDYMLSIYKALGYTPSGGGGGGTDK